jgi:hypothetical protein
LFQIKFFIWDAAHAERKMVNPMVAKATGDAAAVVATGSTCMIGWPIFLFQTLQFLAGS